MTLRIVQASNGQWFLRIVSSNGNILAHSETYVAKSDARHCADLIKAQAGGARIVEED